MLKTKPSPVDIEKMVESRHSTTDEYYTDPKTTRRQVDTVRGRNADDNALGAYKTLADLAKRPPNYELKEVKLSQIFWDNYCRDPRETNLNRLRTNWQPDAIGTIYVSKRPGNHYAGIEGRHRYTVAIEKGMLTLPARIYHDLTYEQEAALYNLFNVRYHHSALDRLQGRIEAKEPKALSMTSLIKSIGLGWDFNNRSAARCIKPVSTIEAAYDTWGSTILRDGLRLLSDAWSTNSKAYQDDTIGGVVQFLARYGGYQGSIAKYDRARMLNLMRERGLRQFRTEAIQISLAEHLRRSHSFGRAMRSIYNLHLRGSSNLPTWPDRFYSESGREIHAANGRAVLEANRKVKASLG